MHVCVNTCVGREGERCCILHLTVMQAAASCFANSSPDAATPLTSSTARAPICGV